MAAPLARLPPPPDRAPDLDESFGDGFPTDDRWVAAYLGHWSTPERSAARYDLDPVGAGAGLRLRIDADQLDWRPEDAPLRVSHLQTGSYAGPLGSSLGTHRHRPDGLTVRTPVPTRLGWAPASGRVDVTLSATRDPGCMVAVWLVGTEHRDPRESGEVCVTEIDAEAVGATATTARCGVKAHHDPGLVTDMAEVVVPLDATRPHTWTAIWGAGETVIGCEGRVVRRLAQSPAYPLFLMLDLFEIGPPSGSYPKTARLHRVVGWADR